MPSKLELQASIDWLENEIELTLQKEELTNEEIKVLRFRIKILREKQNELKKLNKG